jgi:hypothetical protein
MTTGIEGREKGTARRSDVIECGRDLEGNRCLLSLLLSEYVNRLLRCSPG